MCLNRPDLTKAKEILKRHQKSFENKSPNLAVHDLYKALDELVDAIERPSIEMVQCDCGGQCDG
jgi:hypothetical protein